MGENEDKAILQVYRKDKPVYGAVSSLSYSKEIALSYKELFLF